MVLRMNREYLSKCILWTIQLKSHVKKIKKPESVFQELIDKKQEDGFMLVDCEELP
jgi:hypothetical protein